MRIRAEVETTARTGVEMEALTAASVAALNVYDLVKGIDPGLVIEGVRLLEKTKGAARRARMSLRVAVITVSDRSARGEREDASGPALAAAVLEAGGARWCAGSWSRTSRTRSPRSSPRSATDRRRART